MSKQIEIRRKELINYLTKHGKSRIKDLADTFHVTTETIRKDLFILERRNEVLKTHGYAQKNETYDELPIDIKVEENMDLKDCIARKAIEYVPDYSIVYLDPGSTTLSLVRYLSIKKSLTVVTPSLKIAQSLLNSKHEILFIGGLIQKKGSTATGSFALDNLRHVRLDVAFMGTDGFFHCEGPTTFSFQELSVKQKVLEQAHKKILLCDSSKFKKTGTYPFAQFGDYDILITNTISPEERKMVEAISHIVIA